MKHFLMLILATISNFTFGQNIELTDLKKGSVFLIKFQIGESDLDSTSIKDLQIIIKGFQTYPNLKIEISGHTDYVGANKMNLKLSKERAEIVKNYLIKNGVNKKQLTAKGLGGSQPLAFGVSDEIRTVNRRVELMVLDNPSLPKNIFGAHQRNSDDYNLEQQEAKPTQITDSSFSKIKKVALVIGNSDYVKSPKLKNPTNDARLMTNTLNELGFQVSTHINLDYAEMIKAIKDFSYELNGADIVLAYFAGHGMQLNGENYLLPTDVSLNKGANDLPFEGINSNIILRILEYTNKESLNIIILDACRNTPFNNGTRSTGDGLAEIKPPTGSIIAFATSPGSVAFDGDGDNGVYTSELVKQLNKPQRVEDLFMQTRLGVEKATDGRQSPWELFRLRGIYYFKK